MSTVGTLFPTNTPTGVTGATSSSNSSNNQNSTTASDPLANESTFLQLLVAQLQNQDPTQPVDGTTFVTQLAEFSNVEQSLGTRQDLDAISEHYLGVTTPPSAASSLASGSTSSTNSIQSSGTSSLNSSTGSVQSN